MTSPYDRGGVIRVERDGMTLSGVCTGIKTNSFTIRQLAARKRENGWLVHGRTVEPWKPRGLAEHEGEIYLTGPRISGVPLDRALSDPARDRLQDIRLVADAIATLGEVSWDLPLHTRAFILLEDGGVFVLPPEIIRSIIENSDIAEQVRIRGRFNHPDRAGKENQSFFLASLIYMAITDGMAFEGDSSEELNGRIRSGKPVPARYRRIDVRPEISEVLDAALSSGARFVPPATWAEHLDEWLKSGVARDLTDEKREQLQTEAQSAIERADRSFGRSETVRRNWRRWAIISFVSVAVLLVPATIVRNALQPRATAGFSPQEVVEAFYWSINTLDHMTMEDAVVDGAGKPLVREVTNLFVLDRQRMSVEMRSGFVDARDWDDQGRAELPDGTSPYGLTSLALEPLAAPPDEVAYLVTYERWLPNSSSELDEAPDPLFVGFLVADEVRLRKDREDWVIYEMKTVSLDEVP